MTGRKKYDHVLLLAVLAIVVIGIVMITSIGVPKSIELSAPDLAYPDCGDEAVDCYLVLKKHVVRVFVGLIALLIGWKMNFKIWKKLSALVFAFAFVLLIVVLVTGEKNNTFAQSWLNFSSIPFIDSLQPSEIAKFGLAMYLSYFFAEKISREKIEQLNEGFLKFTIISGIMILPIIAQPDLGSSLVLIAIAVIIYFLAGANIKHLAVCFGAGLVFSLFAFVAIDRVHERVTSFIDPSTECLQEGPCWQTQQANVAIGSGGIWGKGLTQGIQKSYWLPQASDDFIFAASAEELGFFRTAFIVFLYGLIAYRGFYIANHAPNKFAMLVAAGLTSWISVQAFINIMVNTALFPVTGITLPFLSYGGSSMVTSLLAIGVLLNISQYTSENSYSNDRRRDSGSRYSKSRYSRRYQGGYF